MENGGDKPFRVEPFVRMTDSQISEIMNIWHVSKCHSSKRYERMRYTVRYFNAKHPEVPSVYKNLDRQLAGW